jgi:hypothetical protein
MTKNEALDLALEALESERPYLGPMPSKTVKAITAIKQALAQPVQEPVAWAMYQRGRLQSFWLDKGDAYDFEFTSEHEWKPLYTTPPAQPAVPDAIHHTDLSESLEYIQGWNDCRQAMMEMMK